MLFTALVAFRHVLHGDTEVGSRMRTAAIEVSVDVAFRVASAILGAGAQVGIDRGSILAGIEIPVAGNFLGSGLGCDQTGLRRYLERSVVAPTALPRTSVRGGIGSAFRA